MLVIFVGLCPTVAASDVDHFPDIPFKVFSDFIGRNFSSKVSLATVLTVLFTLTSNTDLLNLHTHQQNPQNETENRQVITGWMSALSRALQEHLDDDTKRLFHHSENNSIRQMNELPMQLGSSLMLCLNY